MALAPGPPSGGPNRRVPSSFWAVRPHSDETPKLPLAPHWGLPEGLSPAPRKGSPCPSSVLSGAYAAGRISYKATSALAPQGSSTQRHVPVAGTPSKGAGPLRRAVPGANPAQVRVAGVSWRGTADLPRQGRVVGGPRTARHHKVPKNTEERPKPAGEGRDSACNTASTTHPVPRRGKALQIRPRVRGDYPPNLSILLSGGKETNRDSPSKCDRTGRSPACSLEPPFPGARGMPRSGGSPSRVPAQLSPLERGHYPWRVRGPYALPPGPWNGPSVESGCLKLQPKAGGKLHLRLNITTSPIANKYREGKLKRTLKREFKSA